MSSNKILDRASYTIEEIAMRNGVNQNAVCRWLDSGKLKSIKVGHNKRVTAQQEQDFLNLYLPQQLEPDLSVVIAT